MFHYRNVYKKEKFRRACFASVCIYVYRVWPESGTDVLASRQHAAMVTVVANHPAKQREANTCTMLHDVEDDEYDDDNSDNDHCCCFHTSTHTHIHTVHAHKHKENGQHTEWRTVKVN